MRMRTLEKGFGNCSLRTSALICLAVISGFGVLSILGVVFGYGYETTLFTRILNFLFETSVTAVFIYTFCTLLKDESSMLQLKVAFFVLCVDIGITVLGLITSVFTLFIFLIFILIYQAFKCYAAWILYSYWIDLKPPVSVNA
ncbi:uncharacterized protein LOC135838256 [Planococcus citri]|uniref:uncharacterized protein LOC135838256 n=1 Tax=Planococcus citri TaxID=170843 RepID=UPI0031FA35F1